MPFKIVNTSPFPNPEYATEGSAALDLRANIAAETILHPMERLLIPTGISFGIPDGWVGLVCPRSGLASKYGVTVLNAPGIIDSDYVSECKVILVNLSDTDFTILPGERVAQIMFQPVTPIRNMIQVESLKLTTRKGGFGSTGRT